MKWTPIQRVGDGHDTWTVITRHDLRRDDLGLAGSNDE